MNLRNLARNTLFQVIVITVILDLAMTITGFGFIGCIPEKCQNIWLKNFIFNFIVLFIVVIGIMSIIKKVKKI